jgi:hypothetical protein
MKPLDRPLNGGGRRDRPGQRGHYWERGCLALA